MSKTKQILDRRAVLTLGTWAVYVAAFLPLYGLIGPGVAKLGIVPVVATG